MKTKKNKKPKPLIVSVTNPVNLFGSNSTQTKEDIEAMVKFAQELGLKKF